MHARMFTYLVAHSAEEGTCERKIGRGDVSVSSMCTISSSHVALSSKKLQAALLLSIRSSHQLRCPTKEKSPYNWLSWLWIQSLKELWLNCRRAYEKRKALDPQAQAKVSSQQNYGTDHKQLNTYSYVCKIHVNACSCTHGRTNNDHKQKYNTG